MSAQTVENFDGVIVVGGGLAGSLLTICLAKEGHKVKMIEKAKDWRKTVVSKLSDHKSAVRRSINLALSHRGRAALRHVGLEDEVMEKLAYPMFRRAMHSLKSNGQADSFQPYDEVDSENAIYSVSRLELNNILLKAAEALPNVEIIFGAQLSWISRDHVVHIETSAGKRQGLNTYNDYQPATCQIKPKLIVGADGAYSSTREAMLRLTTLDFERKYISAGYKEMHIPPDKDGNFALKDSQALHIWPRGGFMMIGLPNPDKSFTCTIFAPLKTSEDGPGLQDIKTTEEVKEYFARYFPDAIQFMPNYIEDFKRNPSCPLVMTKCAPWNIGDKIVLLGDSAHAMVPFYGQGMNAAFEDVLVFMETLKESKGNLSQAVPLFAKKRKPSGDAIAELSLRNFVEMRSHTADPLFLLRKKFEGVLNWAFPKKWIPLYKMVAFTRIPYEKCIEREENQSWLLSTVGRALATAAVIGSGVFLMKRQKGR
eukprot:g4433.t1